MPAVAGSASTTYPLIPHFMAKQAVKLHANRYAVCAPFSRQPPPTFLQALKTCGFLYRNRKNIIYSQNVLCDMVLNPYFSKRVVSENCGCVNGRGPSIFIVFKAVREAPCPALSARSPDMYIHWRAGFQLGRVMTYNKRKARHEYFFTYSG